METFIDVVSKVISFAVLLVGVGWGLIKFFKRDEHFPRMFFEVSANFVGIQDNQVLFEILALFENKGVVPIKIRELDFKIRGLYEHDQLEKGDETICGQIRIPHLLLEGSWVPKQWNYLLYIQA